jgi:outer membrane autotransporter protein
MTRSKKTTHNDHACLALSTTPQRLRHRRVGALMMGTALSAIVGLGYGRGAYAQVASGDLTTANTSTVEIDGPGPFETQDGFSVNAGSGDGITITTASGQTGDTTFTDDFASSITGADSGVTANNDGTGALSITTDGTVTGADDGGIFALNYGTDLSVTAHDVTGGKNGILVGNYGSGALSITTDGTATGGTDRDGIFALNKGTDLTIVVNNAYGDRRGIFADNRGSGALSVTTTGTGTVTGTANEGILATNSADGSDLTISANVVTGGEYGIRAMNNGSGALSITTHGIVTGTADDGIRGYNGGTELTIIANNNVTGGKNGIFTRDFEGASGALTITTHGTVTGTSEDGINALTSASGYEDLTITTNDDVTGGRHGIAAQELGAGNVNITTEGSVTAQNGTSILARHEGTGDLSVTSNGALTAQGAGSATDDPGPVNGIFATHLGDGALNITSNAIITATDGNSGIRTATAGASTGNQSITVNADISAGFQAIDANHNASGDLTITVNADTVTGGTDGIVVDNGGSGALTLTANGTVIGTERQGIYAKNLESATDLTIFANNVTGGQNGIAAVQLGTGDLTITIVEGGNVSSLGTDTENDFTIAAVANNRAVIVHNNGTVTGQVFLTNSNTFTNAGTWDLAGTTSNFNADGNSLVINDGLIIAAGDGAVTEVSALNNIDTLRNNAGGTIRLANGAAGDVLRIDANAAGEEGTGTGNFIANGGTVALDVVFGADGSAADRLDINGDVILGGAPTTLAFNSVGGSTGAVTESGIEVITVGGTSDADAFVLAEPIEVGLFIYDLSLGQCDEPTSQNWYLCASAGSTAAVLEVMPGVVLNTFARTETLQQRLAARVTSREMATVTASSRGEADLPVAQTVGPWVRSWGDFAQITPDTSTAGTRWETDSWGFEAGIGSHLGDHAGGSLVGSINLRYGATYTELSNSVGRGSINTEGVGMAGSLTWFGHGGAYVDAIASIDFVSIDATSQGDGLLLDGHDDVVYSASLEVGQRIELQGGTTLVPQAQLSWGRMRDGTLTDSLGNVVSFADRETLTSRIGLTVEQDLGDTDLGSGTVFAFANVLNDLSGSRTVTVAGTDLTQSGTGDWLELGGGFSVQSSETTNLFGQVSYREAFDGVRGDAVAVSAGLRMQW